MLRTLVCTAMVAIGTVCYAGTWSVPDNGSTTVISNHAGAKNYVFHNQGHDTTITVQRIDGDGDNVGEAVPLPKCQTVILGVGNGESVVVSDPADTPDTNGASGTFVLQ